MDQTANHFLLAFVSVLNLMTLCTSKLSNTVTTVYEPSQCGDGYAMPSNLRLGTVMLDPRGKMIRCLEKCINNPHCHSMDVETMSDGSRACHMNSRAAGIYALWVEQQLIGTYSHFEMASDGQSTTSCTIPGICPPGWYNADSAHDVSCDWCVTSTRQMNCTTCPAGYVQFSAGMTDCDICPVGYYSRGGQQNCTICPAGYFQNTTGQGSCMACPEGTFQPHSGSAECTLCPVDTFSNVTGSVSCQACQSGYQATEPGSTQCEIALQQQYRLAGGSNSNEGRVEVFYNGEWGTVCDDAFADVDAQVVCRSLGLPFSNAMQHQSAHFGQGTGSIMLDNVECQGDEMEIAVCTHNGWLSHNCGHGEDVGVTCS
ncbi:lysyl oxidase homolog 2 [Lingula anatina]|uniref:Lysyl oxidase homolog 2 n=1 Tax=Lingula anatina TaxID=7574 RepID=A0A1S3I3I8_LINAN|nr:lysyl oxidase homolog 2 [Lingula anatina]|eukprot:XP_013392401.1 lysyl oxidase homolog 2 [Lingula anatina]